jgi:hypothetical protein
MDHAIVILDGMESAAQHDHVQMIALSMDFVLMEHANVMLDLLVLIVQFLLVYQIVQVMDSV